MSVCWSLHAAIHATIAETPNPKPHVHKPAKVEAESKHGVDSSRLTDSKEEGSLVLDGKLYSMSPSHAAATRAASDHNTDIKVGTLQ